VQDVSRKISLAGNLAPIKLQNNPLRKPLRQSVHFSFIAISSYRGLLLGHLCGPACRNSKSDHGEEFSNMFSHVMIGTNDLDKAKAFYDALLGTLGVQPGRPDRHRIFWRTKTGTFSVTKPIDGKAATFANGGTIGFAAASQAETDAFHAAGLAHGGKTCEDPPGIREGAGLKLYIAYLRDPDGNKICALHRVPE
jgi:catechol 2,3-dioxygenase-like lactoylglutathione lyase family enzyme